MQSHQVVFCNARLDVKKREPGLPNPRAYILNWSRKQGARERKKYVQRLFLPSDCFRE